MRSLSLAACLLAFTAWPRRSLHKAHACVSESLHKAAILHAHADVQGAACTRLMRACLRVCTESLRRNMH
eukprot:9448574-Lingulodinium_polyedra.AAC.1